MKKTISFVILVLCAFQLAAKNGSFTTQYKDIRKNASEESLNIQFFDENKIKDIIRLAKDSIKIIDDVDKIAQMEKDIKAFSNVHTISMLFDFGLSDESNNMDYDKQLNALIKRYEELASVKIEEINVYLLAKTKRQSIQTLIILFSVQDDSLILTEVNFKKPISLDEWPEIAEGIKINMNGISLVDVLKLKKEQAEDLDETEIK
jgi:hypothetical protein